MSKLRVLHVEDEKNARLMVADLLGDGVDMTSVETAEEALEACTKAPFDLTLLDWMLPGMDGGEFLAKVRDTGRAGRVVVLTAIGTMERAREAMRAGAFDFMVKPADPDDLLALVEKAERSVKLIDTAGRSQPKVDRGPADAILGSSEEVLTLKSTLERVASSDAAVLIVGESGTGKELVARALHESSGRHRGRLVTVNCAAIPEPLFESELFGHKRGAFTGASADRLGLIELASGGTLFLDEVGELPLASQAKLLRVLQESTLRRVGDTKDRSVDIRVIAATNRVLEVEDLLYRLDVIRLEVPPLRLRISDLPQLLEHFLSVHAGAYKATAPSPSPDQLAFLNAYPWPGNIRQLENTAKRMVLLGIDAALVELRRRAKASTPLAAHAPAPITPDAALAPEDVLPLKEVVREATRNAILSALRAAKGSRTDAARLLAVSRKTLFNKMQDLGIREESHWS